MFVKQSESSKVLVVCDVQLEFMFCIPEEYISKLKREVLSGKWNEIVVIVDENSGDPHIPMWLYEASTLILKKSYGSYGLTEMDDFVEDGSFRIEKEGESWINEFEQLVIKVDGCHETFHVPDDMIDYFKTLKSVTLVGGAEDECLQDIYDALLYFDVDAEINDDLTYGGYFRNQFTDWYEFEMEWVQV